MNEFILDGYEGREHVRDLIAQADQERMARSFSKSQDNSWSLSRIAPALKKALGSIRR